MLERLRGLAERWPWLGTALDVQQRFTELNGGFVAAAVTLSVFLSLFPLILVAIAVVGFFSTNSATDVASEIIRSLGLTGEGGEALRTAIATAEESRRFASVLGLAGLVWSALGVAAAMEYSINTTWQVKRRGLKGRLFALSWMAGAGILFSLSFALAALINYVPAPLAPVNVVVGLGMNFGLFLWTFRILGNRDVGWRPLLPGAVLAAVGLELLKAVGSLVVPRMVASSSGLYGSIGVVFAVLAWLFVFGRMVVYASVLNVVRFEQHRGTVSVELEAPRLPGEVPVEATRDGAVATRTAD